MRKALFFIVLVVSMSTSIFAIDPPTFFTENEQLYVVASSGLNLRAHPSSDSQVLIKIPYGKLVNILNQDQECITIQEIEYVRGSWTKVSYLGYEGYVFDGFLSPLSAPQYHAEVSHEGNVSIFNLLDNWIDINLLPIAAPDTITSELTQKVVQLFEGNETYVKQVFDNGYRSELTLRGVRMMDVYHLVKGFYTSNDMKEQLDRNAIIVKDKMGDIDRIKINLDYPVFIKKGQDGSITLSITKQFDVAGC